ncbi:TetR family transcriptional regulator C-terminal domain-containing protein [Leucobacter sp.]
MGNEAELRQRVRQLVERSPGTQTDFAAAVGLDKVKFSKSLNGSRQFSPIEVVRIAEYCDVSVSWLLGGHSPEDEQESAGPQARQPTATGVRERILDVAWHLLIRRGYQEVHLADVAARAGVTPELLHKHFLTRDELVNHALHRKFSTTFAAQRERLTRLPSAQAQLLALIEMQLPDPQSDSDDWDGWVELWSWGDSHLRFRQLHCDLIQRWNTYIAEIIALGQRQGVFRACDAADVATQLTAMINGMGLQVRLGVPGATPASMRRQLRLFLRTALGGD